MWVKPYCVNFLPICVQTSEKPQIDDNAIVLEPYTPSETFVPLARIKTPFKNDQVQKEAKVRIKAFSKKKIDNNNCLL